MTCKPKTLLRPVVCASLACLGAFGQTQTCLQCVPAWTVGTPTLIDECDQNEGAVTLTKTQPYTVSWPDGNSGSKTAGGGGECLGNEECNFQDTVTAAMRPR